MAKNTHAQEVATGTSDSYDEHELSDPELPQHVVITRPILGEVDRARITEAYVAKGNAIGEPAEGVRDELLLEEADEIDEEEEWPVTDGGDSTPSSQSADNADSKRSQSLRQPARTTENLSSLTSTATSDADSTDGDGRKTEPQPSANRGRQTPAKKAAPKKTGARATMMGAEDDFSEFD
jgi:hypothetical protein